MSRIGAKPLALPSGITLEVKSGVVHVKGPKGEMKLTLLPEVTVSVDNAQILVKRLQDTDNGRARHGLTRQLLASMVTGVGTGFEKKLEIIGVGYKAQVKGKTLALNLGHSHPINFAIPAGIEIVPDEKNKNIIAIRGIDKQLVGQVAAQIRELRPPEPYKGKGVRYMGEHVRRKAGKAATAKSA
jgi:large subunit ribosomal protein L6